MSPPNPASAGAANSATGNIAAQPAVSLAATGSDGATSLSTTSRPAPDQFQNQGTRDAVAFRPFINPVLKLLGGDRPRVRLEEEIEELREKSKTASGKELAQIVVRRQRLEKISGAVEQLDQWSDQTTIRRFEFRKLIAVATRKGIVGNLENGKEQEAREGFRILELLKKYEPLENKFRAMMDYSKGSYPSDSRYVFRLDFSSISPKSFDLYEPGLEAHRQLPIVALHAKLAASKAVGDRKAAAALERLFKLFEEKGSVYEAQPRKLLDSPASVSELESSVRELEGALNDPDLKVFFSKLQEEDEKKASESDAYKARKDLADSVAALRLFPGLLASLEMHEKTGLKEVTAEMLNGFRDRLGKRAEAYIRYLVDNVNRYENIKDWPKAKAFEKKFHEMEKVVDGWHTLKIAGNEKEAFETLKKAAKDVYGYEVSHARGLLLVMWDQVKAIPTFDSFLAKTKPNSDSDAIVDRIAGIHSYFMPTQEERAEACLEMASHIESIRIRRTVDQNWLTYMNAQVTSHKTNHAFFGLGADGKEHWYDEILRRYHDIGMQLDSRDPQKIQEGRKAFFKLQQGSIHEILKGTFSHASSVIEWQETSGQIAAILLASYGGSLAATAVRPFVAGLGRTAAGAITLGTNAAVFTAISDIIHAVTDTSGARHGFSPFKFLGNVLLNAAMMKYLEKMIKPFERLYGKAVESWAVRSASKSLGLKITPEMLVEGTGDAAVRAAVAGERAAIQKNLFTRFTHWIGQTGWETAVFTPWQFPHNAAALLMEGVDDPFGKALNFSFTGNFMSRNLGMVFGLRVGGALCQPLVQSAHEAVHKFALGKSVEIKFNGLNEAATKAFEEFMEAGETKSGGKIEETLDRYEKILLEQRNLLADIPQELRNPDTEALNGRMLKDLATAKLYAKSLVEIFEPGNRYGVRPAEGERHFVYSRGKQAELISILKARRHVFQQVEANPNGLIEAVTVTASGERITKTFLPETSVVATGPYR